MATGRHAPQKKKAGAGKKVGIIIAIVVIVIALLLGGVYFAANHFLGKLNHVSAEDITKVDVDEAHRLVEEMLKQEAAENAAQTGETEKPGETEPVEEKNDDPLMNMKLDSEDMGWADLDAMQNDELINVLLVGQDDHDPGVHGRSDSMMVVSINPKLQKASLISFMRDTYVTIPGYFSNRLNVPYMLGGYPVLADTLSYNFGIDVDGFFEVDFTHFARVIDIIGGLDIEITPDESWSMNKEAFWLEPVGSGLVHLDGDHTLQYARIRDIDGDHVRTQRQRNVIMKVFEKIKDMSLTELMDLMDEILPCVTTSFTNKELMSMATECFPLLKNMEINGYRIPSDEDGFLNMIDGMSVVEPNLYAIKEHVQNEYYPLH